MRSGEAHGWLIAGLINDHLYGWDPDHPDSNTYCPECCGPCGALRDYFNTPRGRAEADSYVLACRGVRTYDWQRHDGHIDWNVIEQEMARGHCINHDQAV